MKYSKSLLFSPDIFLAYVVVVDHAVMCMSEFMSQYTCDQLCIPSSSVHAKVCRNVL
jgi:hypothetical protein